MIRPATEADLPALAALHHDSFPDGWTEEAIGKLLATPGAFALAVERDGAVAGFVLVRVAADEAEILTVAVAPSLRRAGIGRELVEAAAGRAAEAGATAFFLEVATGNQAARALYTRAGFAEAGRRKGYYDATPSHSAEDALVLRRSLAHWKMAHWEKPPG